jgi:aldoxime dehydratase
VSALAVAFGEESGATSWDRALYVDEAGFTNVLAVAYWKSPEEFQVWFEQWATGWTQDAVAGNSVGTFTEIVKPSVERFETLFSSDLAEGVARVSAGLSDPVREHGYWGGARDRMPISQTDSLSPSGVPGYMTVLDDAGELTEKRFGLSWWRSLAALERWAECHPTHLAIFAAAMRYLTAMGATAKLRLYHEVTVATAEQQSFEYYNCHPKTGLLRAMLTTES